MLLRPAYLAATNALAFRHLLPMSDRDNDIEILALRHQLMVLQRHVGRAAFTETDRAVRSRDALARSPQPAQSLLQHLSWMNVRGTARFNSAAADLWIRQPTAGP